MSRKVLAVTAEFSLDVDDLANGEFTEALLDFLDGKEKEDVEVLDFRIVIPNEVLLDPPKGNDSIDSTLSVTMSIESVFVNNKNVNKIRDRILGRLTKAVTDVIVVH